MKQLILLLLLSGCLVHGRDVILSPAEFTEYWEQLERRWPLHFGCVGVPVPPLPAKDDIFHWITFEEVPSDQIETCLYGHRRVRIGADMWDSGCVPHEIGHAVCDFLGYPAGCKDPSFEHITC